VEDKPHSAQMSSRLQYEGL